MEVPAPHRSLWLETAGARDYPPLEGNVRADVLVVGGGLTGLQTAYLLKQAGSTVVLLEARRIGQGVSGHTTAKITALHGLVYDQLRSSFGVEQATIYADANREGVDSIVALIEREGIECDLRREAALTYAESADERGAIEDEVEAAQAAGLPVTLEMGSELPYRVAAAARLEDQACFHPARYMQALAALIDGGGCSVHEWSRATELDEETRVVRAAGGTVKAEHVVLATHFPVFDRGPLAMRVMPRASHVVASPVASAPGGMHISAGQDYHSIRPHVTAEGAYLLLGGQPHRLGEGGDARQRYAALEAWAREAFGFDDVRYTWSTHDIFTADQVPFIGRFRKDDDRIWSATGFKGWGMTHSMVAAMLMRDAVLRRGNPWAAFYDPWRRSPLKGAGKLAAQIASSAKHLVVEKVTRSDDPSCTHMGCVLQRNEAELTWDCPCHGSRFLDDGEVLTGPAISPIEPPPADRE